MSLQISEELIARQTPEAQAIIRLLLARIAEQDQRIAEQDQRIAKLEAELKSLRKTPQNSSLPPSTQHPHAKPVRQKRKKAKRKRGGQPGVLCKK
ncbi:DUF6444 domain-containing protein [Blastopirellula retiformator]|uniref:DUF6444 domain-containing protein n=1 Tax=Blastopirellula retiformator TaxID=2527970 RepID=A0A5C5UUN6_9BACT|nr:DUF6444 domain-containing protein [Blastopirellula retiformator]TWT30144.1 hypothetical protein Enr8_48030 [Blastopirellula retiformator]